MYDFEASAVQSSAPFRTSMTAILPPPTA